MAGSFSQIRDEVSESIATTSLNRPEHMHTVSTVMPDEPITAFDLADGADNVRAVNMRRAGPRSRGRVRGDDLRRGNAAIRTDPATNLPLPPSLHMSSR